jgi:hypothetical protein
MVQSVYEKDSTFDDGPNDRALQHDRSWLMMVGVMLTPLLTGLGAAKHRHSGRTHEGFTAGAGTRAMWGDGGGGVRDQRLCRNASRLALSSRSDQPDR